MTERSGDNRSDRLSDRFDFELNSDNQSNSSILDDFNHLKLTESTEKSFGRHENFYLNSETDPNGGHQVLNQSGNRGQLAGFQSSEPADSTPEAKQSDNLSVKSDNHPSHHRLYDQPAETTNRSSLQSDDPNAGLSQVEPKTVAIASVVHQDAPVHEHQSTLGHSRSVSVSHFAIW